ncbi:MAG TPA: cellulase family glycosylhydrolase [Ktedonobacteraceae bacterium]|nr:cellulase family glycosylhydrolase [Ktedonobacteraceae bacterium]
MNNLIRLSKDLLPKTKFSRRLGCVVLLLMVAVAPLTLYFIHNYVSLNNPGGKTITLPSRAKPHIGNGCGVSQNHDGSYTFSWLHVANGVIMDEQNCTVHLLGLNMGGLFLGAAGHADPTVLSWYSQHIPMNVVREAYNAYWWDTDVYVPKEKMHFRQWLETVVKWQEQQGNYVILDNATQFHNPPCGDDGMGYHVSFCSSQNQAQKNTPLNTTELSSYQPTALAALSDLAKIYANDPAVIFDVWNEPSNGELKGMSWQTYSASMNDRINTVRQYDPNSLVLVYSHDLSYIESGKFPNFTQPNLVWDSHIYSANWNPKNSVSASVSFARNHGQSFMIGEWGGMNAQPTPKSLIPFIKANSLASTYFFSTYLINGGELHPSSLNKTGVALANGYASIMENP